MTAPISIAIPTEIPTRWPMANSANERLKSKPLTAPLSLTRKLRTKSDANTCVATTTANSAETMEPHSTASKPARLSSSLLASASSPEPTLSTSAQARPSGYGRSVSVTSARRSGMEYITPRMPPSAQIAKDVQNGKSDHQPIMIMPGSTKMIDDNVPA